MQLAGGGGGWAEWALTAHIVLIFAFPFPVPVLTFSVSMFVQCGLCGAFYNWACKPKRGRAVNRQTLPFLVVSLICFAVLRARRWKTARKEKWGGETTVTMSSSRIAQPGQSGAKSDQRKVNHRLHNCPCGILHACRQWVSVLCAVRRYAIRHVMHTMCAVEFLCV